MADSGKPSEAGPNAVHNQPSDGRTRLPQIVLIILCVFIAVSSYSTYKLALVSEQAGARSSFYTVGPFIVLVALALAYSVWFITCFTGKVTTEKKQQIFHFAYTFTITAFVILMIPLANPWQPDVIGPISLVRGCVLAPVDDAASVPGAVRCSRAESTFLPASVKQNFEPHAQQTDGQEPTNARCSKTTEPGQPCVESDSYPWLVTLGGFNGVVLRDISVQPSKSTAQAKDSTNDDTSAHPSLAVRTSIIQSGFVVPYYVVLLAFVGGAVSLTRRIPEYQKRSCEGYEPSLKQPELTDLELREVVVFQIMQLVSAPFIAIVAFYALSPSTMNSAIGLAFLSGFASELVLLQVRGIVEGLQPHVTAKTNPVNSAIPGATQRITTTDPKPGTASATISGKASTGKASGTTTIFGRILNIDGMPASGATVQIADGRVSVKTEENGSFTLDEVPLGHQHLTVYLDNLNTSTDVNVTDGPVDIGELRLGTQGAG